MATAASSTAENAHTDHPLAGKQDPGRTGRIRTRFQRAFNGRWERVQGALGEVIFRNDALGLRESRDPSRRRRGFGFNRPGLRDSSRRQRRPDDFHAGTLAERIDALSEWFGYLVSYRIRSEVRERVRRDGGHYTAEHVRDGYMRGIRAAGIELRRSGYDEPIINPGQVIDDDRHDERLQRVYSQAYHDVQVAAHAAETDVVRTARELLQGGGVKPRTIDSRLTERVQKTGQYRTDLISNVRVIDALNTAAIERYVRGGVRTVRLIGGQSDRSEERGIYNLDRVRRGDAPRPPLHPRDTRILIPVS